MQTTLPLDKMSTEEKIKKGSDKFVDWEKAKKHIRDSIL